MKSAVVFLLALSVASLGSAQTAYVLFPEKICLEARITRRLYACQRAHAARHHLAHDLVVCQA